MAWATVPAMPRALLMIADIGGYTGFMTMHRINLSHAQYIVAQLLEAVIDAVPGSFHLAKLEGDAAFFYAELPRDGAGDSARLGPIVARIRESFRQRQAQLSIDRLCSCDGCVQTDQLTLKFVAHLGEVAFQKVKRFRELAGVDVIHVHRLLKNSVPVREYVLMSEPVYAVADEGLRAPATALTEHLEGLGETRAFYVDLAATPVAIAPRSPSLLRRLLGWLKMTWRALPYMIGLRTPCDGFRHAPRLAGAGAPPGPDESRASGS